MKTIIGLAVFIAAIYATSAKLQCKLPPGKVPNEWITMVNSCKDKMRNQVERELNASMTYLAMGAHFSRDVINRPGFAKFFFESAGEEREHAIKIISYLLMRGELTTDIAKLIKNPTPLKENWENGVEALQDALKLEAEVTKSIRDIIITCEAPTAPDKNFNDYHLVDYLTGDFLEEQYRGQRDLAGKVSTLSKMMDTQGPLGEFLFDKKLLNGEPL